LNLAVIERDWSYVTKNLEATNRLAPAAWMLESSFQALKSLARIFPPTNPQDHQQMNAMLAEFEKSIQHLTENPVVTADLFLPGASFPDMEGVLDTTPVPLKRDISEAGMTFELENLKAKGLPQNHAMSVYEYLANMRGGYLLGATGKFERTVQALSDVTDSIFWKQAFNDFHIPLDAAYTDVFMRKVAQQKQPIVILVPPHFTSHHRSSYTFKEYLWLRDHASPEDLARTYFVFGAHRLLNISFSERLQNIYGRPYDQDYIRFMLQKLQKWLRENLRSQTEFE
jgi:hypothetical protein